MRGPLPPIPEELPGTEEVGLALGGLEASERLRLDEGARTIDLRRGDLAGADASYLIPDRARGLAHGTRGEGWKSPALAFSALASAFERVALFQLRLPSLNGLAFPLQKVGHRLSKLWMRQPVG